MLPSPLYTFRTTNNKINPADSSGQLSGYGIFSKLNGQAVPASFDNNGVYQLTGLYFTLC